MKPTARDLLFLVALSLFFLLYALGDGSLASWDEAVYASVAKEAVLSGDWMRFTLGGHPWFDKPPLAIWGTAVFYKLFGITELSARLFSALCGVGTVVVTYLLGRQLFDRWTGFVGALTLLSSSHFLRFARFGMLDAPLTFFLSLALYFFWLGQSRNRYFIFSGVALGLAVMTKGSAAFFFVPIVGIYCMATRRWHLLGRSSFWIGLMVAALIALPWHLAQLWMHKALFVEEVVSKHLWARTASSFDGHGGNWYFYIRTLVNKYHPWVLIAIFSAPFFLFKAVKDRDDEPVFLSAWMFLIFGIVSLLRTKLPWYILPTYPALSLTVAYLVVKVFRESSSRYVKAIFLVIMALHIPYSNIFDQDYSRDIKGIAPAFHQRVPDGKDVYLYQYHESPAVNFYLGRNSLYLESKEDFIKTATKPDFYCLIHAKHLESIGSAALTRSGLSIHASFDDLRLVAKAGIISARGTNA